MSRTKDSFAHYQWIRHGHTWPADLYPSRCRSPTSPLLPTIFSTPISYIILWIITPSIPANKGTTINYAHASSSSSLRANRDQVLCGEVNCINRLAFIFLQLLVKSLSLNSKLTQLPNKTGECYKVGQPDYALAHKLCRDAQMILYL
jgi:hypothetical protein